MRPGERSWRPAPTCSSTSKLHECLGKHRTPSFKKPASYSIIALRNNPESPILSCSSAIVFSGRGLYLYVR
jgi:hypothetical protein